MLLKGYISVFVRFIIETKCLSFRLDKNRLKSAWPTLNVSKKASCVQRLLMFF